MVARNPTSWTEYPDLVAVESQEKCLQNWLDEAIDDQIFCLDAPQLICAFMWPPRVITAAGTIKPVDTCWVTGKSGCDSGVTTCDMYPVVFAWTDGATSLTCNLVFGGPGGTNRSLTFNDSTKQWRYLGGTVTMGLPTAQFELQQTIASSGEAWTAGVGLFAVET